MTLLVALGLAGALIQSPVAPPSAALSGRIVEHGSRTPIAGAQVLLLPHLSRPVPVSPSVRPQSASTDQDGRFEFEDLEAGRYRIMVEKAGFARLDGSEMPVVDLEPGERRTDLNVTLQKGVVIVGRVFDAVGEPLVGVQVLAMHKPVVPPGATVRGDHLVPAGHGAQSNDLGEFRLFSLPPGEYYVQATPGHGNLGGWSAPRATVLLPTYFPGTTDALAAQPIVVGPGQTSGDVVIRMIGAPAFQVSGVVRDEEGRPVVNAMVRLLPEESSKRGMLMMGLSDQSRTDRSGKFAINNVINGTYTLLAVVPVVLSGPARGRGAGVTSGGIGASSFAFSSDLVAGAVGAGVTTETSNGTTIEYRDDTGTRVPVTVNQAHVSGLEVIVRPPAR